MQRKYGALPVIARLPSSRTGILPWLDWRYSLLFPVGVLLIFATLAVALVRQEPPVLTIAVRNSVTNEALHGAAISVGDTVYHTDETGAVRVHKPEDGTGIEVSLDGFRTMRGAVGTGSSLTQTVPLQPSIVQGTLRDAQSGQPLAGAVVNVVDRAGNVIASSTTAADGSYLLKEVPADARLRIDGGEYGTIDEALPEGMTADFALQRQLAAGRVLDGEGEPIQGAIVRSGDRMAVSTGDGTFELTGIGPGAEVTVVASGYQDAKLAIPETMALGDLALEKVMIRGVYANLGLLADPDGLDSLIEIANTTEINAIVIDIKQDTIYYDSQVQFFRDAGTVRQVYDVDEVIARLKENNIYAIARMVVFQDPLVAEARPDLAVHDEATGDLWRNEMGIGWVDAFHEELWDANIALALEALGHGFDEIQYDYVRFPSDGDLTTAVFAKDYVAENRQSAITAFMKRSYEAIHAVDGKLAADLFGYVTLVDDEQYIGQRFSELEPYLDYVCMMIYPSHFEEGNIASAPGHPNDYPYETILESLQRAEQLVPGAAAKFRPWLQDFDYGGMRDYTAADVRAQIDAAEDFGASGWMLWGDPFNVSVDALEPDTGDGN
jgi:hypothetical protein